MSFNKRIIPKVEVLETYLKENGSNAFYWKYIRKVDAMIGNSKGIDYIEEFGTKYYNKNESDPEFYQLD
jgi:hypothetical protein